MPRTARPGAPPLPDPPYPRRAPTLTLPFPSPSRRAVRPGSALATERRPGAVREPGASGDARGFGLALCPDRDCQAGDASGCLAVSARHVCTSGLVGGSRGPRHGHKKAPGLVARGPALCGGMARPGGAVWWSRSSRPCARPPAAWIGAAALWCRGPRRWRGP